MQYTKLFITGASGFIGANLVTYLSKQKYKITVLLRKNSSHPFLEGLPLKHVEGDLFTHTSINSAIAKCDAVIHCAAFVSFDEKDKREIYHTNVTGTENILKYALKHRKRVVFISTASTMGYPSKTGRLIDEKEQFMFKNISSYSHSKYLAEQLVLHYVKKGLDAVIVNPSTIYGAGDLHGTGPSFYALMKRYPIFFAPPGGCSVIAVEDVSAGIIAALEKGKKGERYILTHENITYKQLFTMIIKKIKKRERRLIVIPTIIAPVGRYILRKFPFSSKIITPAVFSNLFKYRYLDNEKAKKELRWNPHISIDKAIVEGYVFYKEHCETHGI